MKSFWEGNFIRLRLFKHKDKLDFFYYNNYYCYMNKGHFEWELATNFPNFDSYFNQNCSMHYDHNFSLIIASLVNDKAIGIMQVYDTNTRNGTFFVGMYLKSEFESKDVYLEVLNIIKKFMFNELRYNEGFITISNDQTILHNAINQENYEKCAHVKKRYYQEIDQHLYRLKGDK